MSESNLKHLVLERLRNAAESSREEHLHATADCLDDLAARLQRATVTEPAPDFPLSDQTLNKLTNTMVMGKSLLGWIQTLHDMEQMYMPPRADAPAPTDALSEAELRERLQAALPDVIVERHQDNRCWASFRQIAATPTYAALRKPGGIEACARALRVLAGVEGE